MTDDNSANAAAKTPPPQIAGIGAQAHGAARAGNDAPVFVDNKNAFFAHLRSINAFPYLWMTSWRFGLILFCPALAYGLFFGLAGFFPQFHQAWLDFCLPLAEYVGGLTPRAGRIAGELIAGGYPERADDALHGIAMSRVMLFPFYIYWLMAIVVALTKPSPAIVSCARWTRVKIWLVIFGLFVAGMAFFYFWDFVLGEDVNPDGGPLTGQYHRSNNAIFTDILFAWGIGFCFALGIIHLSLMRTVRFNIVDYNRVS